MAAALAPAGIDGTALGVLLLAAAVPASSQLEMATRLHVDRTTMVSLVDSLECKALIERRPDPTDRRRNVIALSALGREIAGRGSAALADADAPSSSPSRQATPPPSAAPFVSSPSRPGTDLRPSDGGVT